jgi:CrcB protein
MTHFYGYVLVFFGAGLGGMLRHAANRAAFRMVGPNLPAGTFAVNLFGSLAIGALAGYLALKGQASANLQLFVTTGVLGGFTTFSAFSLEAALFWQRGQLGYCVLYVMSSVVLSIAGVFAGLRLLN